MNQSSLTSKLVDDLLITLFIVTLFLEAFGWRLHCSRLSGTSWSNYYFPIHYFRITANLLMCVIAQGENRIIDTPEFCRAFSRLLHFVVL